VTHGHEDHTGALPYLLKDGFNAPIYATKLTRGLLEVKLKQHKVFEETNLNTIAAGETVTIGPFKMEFFRVAHSIPDGVGLGITTPAGLVVHTGDFKFDHTPVDGKPTDFARLAEFGGRGALALMSDSTNADQPGTTPSERVIDGAFDRVFREAQGRIIIGTFASLISRIQQAANAAMRYRRRMAIAGTSMAENVRMAQKLGYLTFPDDLIVRLDEAARLRPRDVVIMATGTQGEPSSVLARVAAGEHSQIKVQRGDTVIMSSHPVPGNEEMVHRTINRLFQRGAEVLYDDAGRVRGVATGDWRRLLNHNGEATPSTRAELLARWDAATAQIDETWPSIPASRFRETDTAFGQYPGLVSELLLYFVDNEIHHRGQGYVYLRSLGITPPGFYERE